MAENCEKDEKYNGATLLTRIDERTKQLVKDIVEIKEKLESHYVNREEFNPVKNLVYAGVGVILIAVVGAIVALVVK